MGLVLGIIECRQIKSFMQYLALQQRSCCIINSIAAEVTLHIRKAHLSNLLETHLKNKYKPLNEI